eukprot:CAMPEP_0195032904 /NCGR_PEP_ID=MMETSP0326_2-20130528/64454_1 /TAXON_ID=2866 ORGANISM="Crypthecodinium cohnii, Strain Seligo" /NCGR_SAMPLE_ID=MMETSP0326_2 /ASSEMBLY_ACC=CAM_ASM_000348 /LENGTH=33 /DNA_ID= /DNA_START= /DNA_END= /DNA_ORIENTATION=
MAEMNVVTSSRSSEETAPVCSMPRSEAAAAEFK